MSDNFGCDEEPSCQFAWNELLTNDVEGAKSFYTSVFGWETAEWPLGGAKYEVWKDGDATLGGLMQLPPEFSKAPLWLSYVKVADVDIATEKAQELGGKVVIPVMDIANIGRIAVLTDPQGAVFGVAQFACCSD